MMEKQDSNSLLCPVCSLFLREGISLKDHLQTHSKEKVIEALLKNSSTADLDQLIDLTSNTTTEDSSLSNSNSHTLEFNRNPAGIVPTTSSFVEPSSNQVTPTTPSILSCINNVQFPSALSSNVIGQPSISNAYTYQQFITNEGNIVFIPVYNVGPTSVIVPNNIVANSLVNQCMVVPSNPVQPLNVINPTTLSTTNVFSSSASNGPPDPEIHIIESNSSNNSITAANNAENDNADDKEEKETDDEVANIFDQTLQNGQGSKNSLENQDDKSSYPSTTPSVASLLDNDIEENAYEELGHNELIPPAAVSVIRVRSNLDFESDSSPFLMEDNDKHGTAAHTDYTNSSVEPSPISSPVKSDPVSLQTEPTNDSSKCHSHTLTSNSIDNKNTGILETQSHPSKYDFVISNSDNAMHILPDSTDESLDCITGRRNDQYILPNYEIPQNCSVNANAKSDYNFLGIRNSFLSSASLISSVNKTMFADVDVYNSAKSTSNCQELNKEGVGLDFKIEELSVIVKSNKDNTLETEGAYRNSSDIVESAGSSRISPFNIQTDESMPPRGEISGQESLSGNDWEFQMHPRSESFRMTLVNENQDMKIDLQKIINDMNGAKESTNFNNNEKFIHKSELPNETITSSGSSSRPKKIVKREFICFYCRTKFDTWKERQSHISEMHSEEDGLTIESLFGKRVFYKQETVKTEDHQQPEDGTSEATTCASYIECRICSESFHTSIALLKHLKVLHGIRKRSCVCPTCFLRFASATEYQQHIEKVHPYECMTCGKKFHTRPGYMLHQKRHMKLKPYSCNDCDKSFVTKQKLVEHVNVHTGDNPIKCELCDCQFKRYSNYQQHKKYLHLRHKRKLKDFVCDCGEVFHSKLKLLWHREIHDERPKQCPFCVERFVHAASLTRHVRKWHNQTYISEWVAKRNVNLVECPICNVCYLHSSLQTHMKIHDNVKPFACTECSRSFRTKWNLQLHKWTHTSRSAKPFKCKLCVKAYVHKIDYDAHMRSHNNNRPYACNVCGRQFIRKYNCIRHMREHQEPRAYKCNVCGKLFSRSYYLTEHEKVHTGEKPHVCHICGKASATKSNHNKHVKMHNVVRESVNSES